MVFCIVLGDNTETAFLISLPSDKKVGELRELIAKNNPKSFTDIDAKDLILWQVSISDEDVERMKILNTKPPSDIKIEELGGKVMSSRKEVKFYFPKDPVDEHIHIIIVRPQPPATTGPSQQGITQVTPPEPDVIFNEFLGRKHGQFLETYTKNSDPLPSYKSPIHLKTSVPANSKGDRPCLLLHNLPDVSNISQSITQVSSIRSAVREAKNNLLVLLGTSGCGKTRSCYELLCCNWGLYFVSSRKGNGGSNDIEMIENYIHGDLTEDWEENRNKVDHITRCAILSRLLILIHCVKSSTTFNPQRWLLLQICQKIFGKLYSYSDDIFRELMLQLVRCTRNSVINHIDSMYQEIRRICDFNDVFPIILDEAQELEMVLKGKFRSRYDPNKPRSLISPIIQTFKIPTPSFSNHCAVACGTGLGLLHLDEVLASAGIAKPDLDIDKFTDFGKWKDISHVKEYISSLLELKLTEENFKNIYNHFRGRFRPIVTCTENIIMGDLIDDAVKKLWADLTQDSNSEQSIYRQLSNISNMERNNHVLSVNVLDLCLCITLAYYYSGGPFLFTNFKQIKIIEYGFGYLQKVKKPPTITQLKPIFGDEVDDGVLRTSSVDLSLLSSSENDDILIAYVDEPFALNGAYNFFKDKGSLTTKILEIMSTVNNPSSCGFLWEKYLPEEFTQIFNGQIDIKDLPIFFTEIPDNFKGSPKIVKPSNTFTSKVANSTMGYTLDRFFSEPSESRPTFYFPENLCGPDLIFFIEFENNLRVPVFVQVKLRYSISVIEDVLSTLHPKMFYRDRNGKMASEKTNKPVVEKITKLCEETGSIGILVAYPADVFDKFNLVTSMSYDYDFRKSTKNKFNIKQQLKEQLIGIIDNKNASKVFRGDHITFLKALKNTVKEKKMDEEDKADEERRKGCSRSRKKQKKS